MKDRFILTPFYLDQSMSGLEDLAGSDWQLNKPPRPPAEPQRAMVQIYRPLADFVAQAAKANDRPVSIAGDCCTSIGVLAGLQRAGLNPTLIWFDAHGDFNTWETSPSGFLGGMPLAMLAGLGEQTIVEGVRLKPQPESQIILTDGRDLDPGERDLLSRSQVTHLPSVEALLETPLPEGPLYVHFDTDVITPEEAPAMNYLTPGGPSSAALQSVFRHLAATGRVKAVSLSTWNPELDLDGRSQEVSMRLLQELLR